ncbi:MAG: hypothetical protein KAT79_03695, partial [candidate division Zixibacteria bacterium]|nr:hypothetical protein [candidate division Zixibacteria bacterium]
FGNYFERARLDYLMDLLRKGLLLIAVYGIFLFIYRLVTGDWIEIPFLTVNYGDLGGLDYKHINRGGIFKLISTYNNGNIYGICVLMLLPLYERLEKKGWKVWIVKASLLLTLSRTVWIGLVVYELAMQFYIRREFSKTVLRQFVVLLVGSGWSAQRDVFRNGTKPRFSIRRQPRWTSIRVWNLAGLHLPSTRSVSCHC